MLIPAGPRPRLGWTGEVILANYPLVLVPGTYQVSEPERFGTRQSVGSLSYASYAPYEQASVATRWMAGFGLRRYSDEPDENIARAKILEGTNADTRGGLIHIASSFTTETLPSSSAPVVWLGEYTTLAGTKRWVAVAGTKVYYRNADGTWTDTGLTLPSAARHGAVGVFGTNLIIGFGSDTTAKYTNDLTTLGNVVSASGGSLYLWAITVDRAVAYGAVSTSVSIPNVVASSVDGVTYVTATGTVTCGSPSSQITGLAPGGGIQTVFVAKETEIGLIDTQSIYRVTVPLDTKLATNGRGMRWWLGRGDDEQRGPLMLVFPRDRSPAAYVPSNQGAGQMQSISPWGKPTADPPNVKGIPNAFVGTARWLYYSITNTAGQSWIIAHDMQTSVAHAVWYRGSVACNALGITNMFSSIPYLFAGNGNDVARTQLPFDGDLVLNDEKANSIPLGTTCSVDFPYDDGGLPDEDKVLASVRVISRNAAAINRTIAISYDLEESRTYLPLGTATVSPHQELVFAAGTQRSCKRVGLRAVLTSSSTTNTPVLVALGLRYFPTPKLYRYYSFAAMLPAGSTPLGPDDLHNAKRVMDDLWDIRMSGVPTPFYDRWGDFHAARIIELGEKDVKDERERVPETQFLIKLLETIPGSAVPEVETTVWYAPTALGGGMLPLALPWNPVGYGSYVTEAKVVTNPGSLEQFPLWHLYGQQSYVSLVNTTTGKSLTLENIQIPPGGMVTIDPTPGRQTVYREDSEDLRPFLAPGYEFWSLAPGDNVITVTQGGTHDGARVELLREIV